MNVEDCSAGGKAEASIDTHSLEDTIIAKETKIKYLSMSREAVFLLVF
jgi:hypothetical protein